MNNTRFATVIHIMTLLAKNPQDWLTSQWIAGSLNINPAMVRKELITLKKCGLIESRQGKEGGAKIAKSAEDIIISDLYLAVKNTEVLGKKNQNPNPKCSVGKKINENLEALFSETDDCVIHFLNNKKLSDFMIQFD